MESRNHLYLVAGSGEGETPLNAFDRALLEAGIGDVNLVKVSSIVPPGWEVVKDRPTFRPGSLVPVVYIERTSHEAGQKIAVALAVGQGEDGFGVIMECEGSSGSEAEAMAVEMVRRAFQYRKKELMKVLTISAEHIVHKCGAVVAACAYGEWRL